MESTTPNKGDDVPNVPLISKAKRRIFGAIAILAGLLFGLVVAEIGLRIAGYSSPDFFTPNKTLGYSLIPNLRGNFKKEGKSFVAINSEGFRDVEHQVSKPAGVMRIAIIGDSFVEGMQVEQSEGFGNYLGEELNKCGAMGSKQVEILNFGVSGYGTAQELLNLREKVWRYSPDVVILLMTTNNDITDNSRFFRKKPIPYFVYKDGVLTLDNSFREEMEFVVADSGMGRLGTWLKNNLRVVEAIGEIQVALKHRYRAWKDRQPEPTSVANAPSTATPVAEVGIDSQIYRAPADANWENAWKVTEGLIGLMQSEVEEHGAKFVVVTGSNGAQVLPNIQERQSFERLLGVDDLFYPDRRIADLCRTRSIPVITLAPVLAEYAARENKNLHGFEGNLGYGHWNQLGHKIVGETIGKKLCEGSLR